MVNTYTIWYRFSDRPYLTKKYDKIKIRSTTSYSAKEKFTEWARAGGYDVVYHNIMIHSQ